MRIWLAQINPKVGDLEGNYRKAIEALADMQSRNFGYPDAPGAPDLVVFSEMSVIGYPPNDLLDRPSFVSAAEIYSELWAKLSKGGATAKSGDILHEVPILFGSVRRVPYRGAGKKLQNVAHLAVNGEIVDTQAKSLLPTYDVFSEDRYFEPADYVEPMKLPLKEGSIKLGVCICEDIWNDKEFWQDRLYDNDPIEILWQKGAKIIVNLSASPYSVGKPEVRQKMLSHTAKKFGLPLVYVNQVGGNDDVLYDGQSMAFDANGKMAARLLSFKEWGMEIFVQGGEVRAKSVSGGDFEQVMNRELEGDMGEIYRALIMGIKDYTSKCGFKKVVIGLSGGIDSAVTAALAVRAMGAKNVLGIAMPSRYSSEGSVKDAEALAKNLGIGFEIHPIGGIYDAFFKEFGPPDEKKPDEVDVALENLQARIRGGMLMAHSNRYGHLLLTTGNKSEIAVGYCTLYGDTCGGLAVISDLLKTKVYALARFINDYEKKEIIPVSTIEKPPSAELRPDQKDEDSLPPYDFLDFVLQQYIEEQKSAEEIVDIYEANIEEPGKDPNDETIRRICRMVDRCEYKRQQLAPGLRVTKKAFGSGRIMPIAQGWEG